MRKMPSMISAGVRSLYVVSMSQRSETTADLTPKLIQTTHQCLPPITRPMDLLRACDDQLLTILTLCLAVAFELVVAGTVLDFDSTLEPRKSVA